MAWPGQSGADVGMDRIRAKIRHKGDTKVPMDDEDEEEDNPIKQEEEAKKKAKALQARNVNPVVTSTSITFPIIRMTLPYCWPW